MEEDTGYRNYCEKYEEYYEEYGIKKLDEQEYRSIRKKYVKDVRLLEFLAIKYYRPKLRNLNPKSKLLESKFSIKESGDKIHVRCSEEFAKMFRGIPFDVALLTYISLLEVEIEKVLKMTDLERMHLLLGEMVKTAKEEDSKRLLELNGSYKELIPRVYPSLPEPLWMEYDNCRESCIMTMTMPDMREQLILEAKRIFSKIPKP